MKKQLAMIALIAAILGGAAYAMFRAPWYVASTADNYFVADLRLIELETKYLIVLIVAALVNIYFFVRLMFTGLLVLNGGPTSTRTIAWYTPFGAHLQGAFAVAAAIVMNVLTPEHSIFGLPAQVERSWGGWMFLACTVAAHLAIAMIARDPELARTQTWADDEGVPIKKKRRWIRAAPQERPLVRPPLVGTTNVGGDPFRAAPPTGLEAKLVKPETKKEAPRVDDKDAPAPKHLV